MSFLREVPDPRKPGSKKLVWLEKGVDLMDPNVPEEVKDQASKEAAWESFKSRGLDKKYPGAYERLFGRPQPSSA